MKSDVVYARVEPDVKGRAEAILSGLGVSASSAIGMFYRQIILHGCLTFDVAYPAQAPRDMTMASDEELNDALERGWRDVQEGRVTPISDAMSQIRGDLSL